jgi:alkylation response protein AidB-like acyl-CoA dehydrogenase
MTMPNTQMQDPDVEVIVAASVLGHRPSTPSPEVREILDRAQALVPKLRERLVETEQLRRLPDTTIADAHEAELFALLLPKSLGGAGGDAEDFVQLVRILAHGHLGACWTLAFLVEHNYMLARFPKECQDEVFVDGKPAMMSGVISPPGKAVAVEGGYLITGRWGYATGVMHADWVQGSAIIEGTDDVILFLVPREDVEVEDTWHMSGMQATGSHHIKIDSQFVPAYRCPNIDHWASRDNPGSFHPERLYHTGLRDLIGFMYPAMAVGAAEVLLEEFRQRIERRRQPFSSKVVADTGAGQLRYARAFGALQTARATLEHTVERTTRADAETDGDLDPELRAGLKLALMSVLRMAWESIDLGIRASGTSIYTSGASTQHYIRDVEIMLSHQTIDEDAMYSITGEILLGRSTDSYIAII